MKALVPVRRWVLRTPHWSSFLVAACFGVMAWLADHSLFSVLGSSLISFWIFHLAGNHGLFIAFIILPDVTTSLFKAGPHHWPGINDWLKILTTLFFVAYFIGGLLIGPMALGKWSEYLSRRSNNQYSRQFYLYWMIVPYALLWFLPIGISMY